jgi:hypothetical protein
MYLLLFKPVFRVNKLRSINLLFTSMFCIECKIIYIVWCEKIIKLYLQQVYIKFENLRFTFNYD